MKLSVCLLGLFFSISASAEVICGTSWSGKNNYGEVVEDAKSDLESLIAKRAGVLKAAKVVRKDLSVSANGMEGIRGERYFATVCQDVEFVASAQ